MALTRDQREYFLKVRHFYQECSQMPGRYLLIKRYLDLHRILNNHGRNLLIVLNLYSDYLEYFDIVFVPVNRCTTRQICMEACWRALLRGFLCPLIWLLN
ncbi:hypothetical protein PMI17_00403 [Pantoea sp. GM01]|nr:hypothetical protein PMI17_00403 [Pantoea sp. GM01]